MTIKLEICAGSLNSALAAQAGGADRIELCDNLAEGGTTPSPGIIRQAVSLLEIPVFVLIRPRSGDFLYSDAEFEAMKDDIRFCKEQGATGVVLGVLNADGSVDIMRTAELAQLARPMSVTFHRAFDHTADPFRAMEDIVGTGIDRILTSGQAAKAEAGAELIKQLVSVAKGRITIMPGSGINEDNVIRIIRKTSVKEIHASLRSPVRSRMTFAGNAVSMGSAGQIEPSWLETSTERVKEVITLLKREFTRPG